MSGRRPTIHEFDEHALLANSILLEADAAFRCLVFYHADGAYRQLRATPSRSHYHYLSDADYARVLSH